MIKVIRFRISGTTPLLMHAPVTIDPTSKEAKSVREITSKRKKTEADHEELARREFLVGFWLDAAGKIIIPARALCRALRDGGTIFKTGKAIAERVVSFDAPLLYDGPATPEELWGAGGFCDRQPVKVGQARLTRTRPRFNEWAAEATFEYVAQNIDADDIEQAFSAAGRIKGLGDGRTIGFGRFGVEKLA